MMMAAVARAVVILWCFLLLQPCPVQRLGVQCLSTSNVDVANNPPPLPSSPPHSFLIVGGTGRIGTAVATHLLARSPGSNVTLAGRDRERGEGAVREVRNDLTTRWGWGSAASAGDAPGTVAFRRLDLRDESSLRDALHEGGGIDCVVHTAGPYLGCEPSVLRDVIASDRCRAYVDVSDPLDYLEEGLSMNDDAVRTGTSALMAAGAFPGMSNVLASEAASSLPGDAGDVRDVRFNYFTAGLGGSGDVNLYITNLGFGEPMVQYARGRLQSFGNLSGRILGRVSFFLDKEDVRKAVASGGGGGGFGNDVARERIGTRSVFSWPFPEAATVAGELNATGDSSAAMGTAPDAWNVMLGVLVSLVPRPWWRSERFSKFLADFSQPLVRLTDGWLRLASPDDVGETHAMRVDVTGEGQSGRVASVSVVQAHESFRRCVGQSCAEFALDLLEHPSPGVALPERRYGGFGDADSGGGASAAAARERIIRRLTSTPGTLAFTGAVAVESAPPPTDLEVAVRAAKREDA